MDLTVVAYATLGLSLLCPRSRWASWILQRRSSRPSSIRGGGRCRACGARAGLLGWLIASWPLDIRDDACRLYAAGVRAGRAALARAVRAAQRRAAATLRLPRGILALRGRAG